MDTNQAKVNLFGVMGSIYYQVTQISSPDLQFLLIQYFDKEFSKLIPKLISNFNIPISGRSDGRNLATPEMLIALVSLSNTDNIQLQRLNDGSRRFEYVHTEYRNCDSLQVLLTD